MVTADWRWCKWRWCGQLQPCQHQARSEHATCQTSTDIPVNSRLLCRLSRAIELCVTFCHGVYFLLKVSDNFWRTYCLLWVWPLWMTHVFRTSSSSSSSSSATMQHICYWGIAVCTTQCQEEWSSTVCQLLWSVVNLTTLIQTQPLTCFVICVNLITAFIAYYLQYAHQTT